MSTIEQHLGDKAELLLNFSNAKISKDRLHLPGPDFVDRVISLSDRNNRVLVNLQRIYQHGRLGGSGYVSILPVDQGIEHSAGASFAKNPDYFDPENIVPAGARRRVQRSGFHLRSAGGCLAEVRSQDSVHC